MSNYAIDMTESSPNQHLLLSLNFQPHSNHNSFSLRLKVDYLRQNGLLRAIAHSHGQISGREKFNLNPDDKLSLFPHKSNLFEIL